MAAGRFRVFASVFPILLAIPVLRADVTLRYKTEVTMNPNLPAQMAGAMAGAMKGPGSAAPRESVVRLKGGKGFYTAAGFNSIADFTTQEITLLDASTARYAKLNAGQVGKEMADAMPKMPAEASAAMASMKTDVTPARATGRTAVIQGVETEEREIVVSITGPAMPNMPPGPMVRMVMQLWTAKPGEILRVPAIRELTGYSLWSFATMNPAAGIEAIMKQMPGLSDVFEPIMNATQKGTTMMRMHTELFMPMMAAMLQLMPAAGNTGGASFDPDAPLMQMNLEAVELSTEPVPDSVFLIPEGYQEAVASDVIKGVFAKIQAPAKQ
jgi:hypothetical protein